MFGCKVCAPADPVSDTVRLDIAALTDALTALAKAQADEVGEESQRREHAQEADLAEQQRRAEEEEAEAHRQAKAERLRAEEARARQQEAERRAAAEALRLAEEAARREAAERAEAAQRAADAEFAAAEARKRKAAVAAFLRENGYTNGASGPKKCMTKTKYPLHTAAKRGGAIMVLMLLQEGADASQKDSAGKTAAQVAQRANRNNSHAQVLGALAAASAGRRAAGGA